MNEYGAEFPLWGYAHDDDGPYFREDLVSAPLAEALRQWAEYFDTYYDLESGWQSLVVCKRQMAAGKELLASLKAELEPEVSVEFDFWEARVQGEDLSVGELSR